MTELEEIIWIVEDCIGVSVVDSNWLEESVVMITEVTA